jgi:hypothetical protein
VLGAAGDDDIRRGIGEAVLVGELAADRLLEGGHAGDHGILGKALGDGIDGRLLGVGRGIQVGFARAQAQNVLALGLEGLVLRVDGDGLGRADAPGTRG